MSALADFDHVIAPKANECLALIHGTRLSSTLGATKSRYAIQLSLLALRLSHWLRTWREALHLSALSSAPGTGSKPQDCIFTEYKTCIVHLDYILKIGQEYPRQIAVEEQQKPSPSVSGDNDALVDNLAIKISEEVSKSHDAIDKISDIRVALGEEYEAIAFIQKVVTELDRLVLSAHPPDKLLQRQYEAFMGKFAEPEEFTILKQACEGGIDPLLERELKRCEEIVAEDPTPTSGHSYEQFRWKNSTFMLGDNISKNYPRHGQRLPTGARHQYKNFTSENCEAFMGNSYEAKFFLERTSRITGSAKDRSRKAASHNQTTALDR